MRLTLDTNVLVYAADRDAGSRHDVALDLIERAIPRDCVITLQALCELFRILTVKKRVPVSIAADIVQHWRDTFPVVAADENCLVDAIGAVGAHSWSFWDAMMLATAGRNGCRLLVSEDGQAGRTLGNVTLVNPFDPASEGLDLLTAALDSH